MPRLMPRMLKVVISPSRVCARNWVDWEDDFCNWRKRPDTLPIHLLLLLKLMLLM